MLITISRQYGARSAEVARLVAEALGWTLIDNAFIDRVAERAGIPPEEVARLEERIPSFMERLSRYSAMAFPELFPTTGPIEDFDEAKLVKITRGLVTELRAEGRMVLVGRAAAAVLAHEGDVLHVRLVASRPYRVAYAKERHGIDTDEAEQVCDAVDQNRDRYHREFYDRDWKDAANYHMVLNTELLGVEGAADVIVARARALGW